MSNPNMESIIAKARQAADKLKSEGQARAEQPNRTNTKAQAQRRAQRQQQSANLQGTQPSAKALYLFAQFDLIFGMLWERQHYQDQNKLKAYIEKWNEVLADIPPLYIEVVCKKMALMPREELKWIPRFGDFTKMCHNLQPQELGFLSTRLAYAESYALVKQAQKFPGRRWSHPVVFATAMTLFSEDKPNCRINESEYSLFQRLYFSNIKAFLNGTLKTDPAFATPRVTHKPPRNKAIAENHLQALREKFNRG